MDIRNSVVWTGKIPEKVKDDNENDIENKEEEIKNEKGKDLTNSNLNNESKEKIEEVIPIENKGNNKFYFLILFKNSKKVKIKKLIRIFQ